MLDCPRRIRSRKPVAVQDAFYASCIEAETPSLKHRPLAVQQKQIVVTCNYEARRRV